jgi:hypothetical protein
LKKIEQPLCGRFLRFLDRLWRWPPLIQPLEQIHFQSSSDLFAIAAGRVASMTMISAGSGSADLSLALNAGANGSPDLGGHRCRDHEDRGDSTNYRKPAEQNSSLPWLRLPLPV